MFNKKEKSESSLLSWKSLVYDVLLSVNKVVIGLYSRWFLIYRINRKILIHRPTFVYSKIVDHGLKGFLSLDGNKSFYGPLWQNSPPHTGFLYKIHFLTCWLTTTDEVLYEYLRPPTSSIVLSSLPFGSHSHLPRHQSLPCPTN